MVLILLAVIAILAVMGTGFVIGVRDVLTTDTQKSLQNIAEQGAQVVSGSINGRLDTLSALSRQSGLTNDSNKSERMRILILEAGRKNFHSVCYAQADGTAITSDGVSFSVKNREYFHKAMQGEANISDELIDLLGGKDKLIAYAVPVTLKGKVVGVLFATTISDGRLSMVDNVAVGSDKDIYVLSRTGSVISSREGQAGIKDFFHSITRDACLSEVQKVQRDFLENKPGKGAYTINATQKLMGYNPIPGTQGWMLMVSVDKNKIMGQANRILLMSAILIFILILELVVIAIYFFKLRKSSWEAHARREEEIEYFTYTDTLTKLPNRNGIKKQTAGWLDLCRKNGKNGGAFFLDLDNFKSVNNTFGHDAGDEFLAETAVRLQRVKGKNNVIGRIGGNEFALLVLNVDSVEDLKEYAKQILEIFKEPYSIKENMIQLSASVGAILFNYKEKKGQNEFDEIIGRGEFVLEEAKRLAKGSYALFTDDFGKTIDRQHKIDGELKQAIHKGELTCYYQPQYNSTIKKIVGFEALARWNSASFGVISPPQFIEMAEKNGFINELGRYVVDQAFAFAKSLEGENLCISFNTSPAELMQVNFTDFVIDRFNYYGLKPGSVAIEVTESCLIESFDEVVKKLKILSEHGIMVCLDDFGTGYSSLTYLKKLPISSVKIDKSFIDEITTDKTEKDIVDMIVLLANKLNLEVVAEGVETEEQLKCVADCGCKIIQGYYISMALPSDQAKKLLGVLPKNEESQKSN